MVRRGEYLERAVVVPGSPTLEGLYHRGTRRPPVVLLPPHPRRGGGMESPTIAELAWALTRAGHATLRVGYPGVGASGGVFEGADLDEVCRRAIDHLAECVAPGAADRVAVAGVGVGLGGALLVEAARSQPGRVEQVIWVAPEPEAPPPAGDLETELTVVLPQGAEPGWRSTVRGWVDGLPRGRCATVVGADPTFRRGLVEVGRIAVEALHPPGLLELPEDG